MMASYSWVHTSKIESKLLLLAKGGRLRNVRVTNHVYINTEKLKNLSYVFVVNHAMVKQTV